MNNHKEIQYKAKPFVKWAGGKTQVLPAIRNATNKIFQASIEKYCEPFVGGGAVFFDIIQNYQFQEILLNDINADLINAYIVIKDAVAELLLKLSEIERAYLSLREETRKEYYYEKRAKYNDCLLGDVEKAAILIFLNKTCFNGLYRVNSRGKFNVPFGRYANPVICNSENINAVSVALAKSKITCTDYTSTDSFIDERTFVYMDPPYRPISQTSAFTSYTMAGFDDGDQRALKGFIATQVDKGATILLSNSDPTNNCSNDLFFDHLYSEYCVTRIEAKRTINSKAGNRGTIRELLITNRKI